MWCGGGEQQFEFIGQQILGASLRALGDFEVRAVAPATLAGVQHDRTNRGYNTRRMVPGQRRCVAALLIAIGFEVDEPLLKHAFDILGGLVASSASSSAAAPHPRRKKTGRDNPGPRVWESRADRAGRGRDYDGSRPPRATPPLFVHGSSLGSTENARQPRRIATEKSCNKTNVLGSG